MQINSKLHSKSYDYLYFINSKSTIKRLYNSALLQATKYSGKVAALNAEASIFLVLNIHDRLVQVTKWKRKVNKNVVPIIK